MASVVIVGLGVSGLGCAVELVGQGIPFVAYEQEGGPGGLARTDTAGAYRFDHGPHILVDRPDEVPGLDLALCAGRSGISLGPRLERVIPAPFQRHLDQLPLWTRVRLSFDVLAARYGRKRAPGNYSEYAIARCGRGIYDLFLRGYDTKRLRCDLQQIPADWTTRVERASLRSLVFPRRAREREGRFFYPRSDGIEALPRAMARLLPEGAARYGARLAELDPRSRSLAFEDGAAVRFRRLVLSLPLPEIVGMIRQAPAAVRSAAENLLSTSIYVISAGIDSPVPPWFLLRIPDPELPFYRLSFPSHYSPACAPEGKAVVVGEISHHPARHPLSAREARAAFDQGLRRMGILKPGQRTLIECVRQIEYGHVLYNHATRASVQLILDYLRANGICTCGKYGQWRDMLIPQAIRSGIAAAREIASAAE